MAAWKPGDRVEHPTFGPGTVLECDDRYTTVQFDDRRRRQFSSAVVTLTATSQANPYQQPTGAPSGVPAAPPSKADDTEMPKTR